MLRHAARFLLFTLLATTAACQRSPASGGTQVWRAVPSSVGAMAASNNASKSTTIVPAIVVDNPSTTGRRRKQNACDKCSLCLGKVGSTANSRGTLKNIYQEGVYEYESRTSSLDKCLRNRHCRDCGAQAVTYTLPNTTFSDGDIQRIFEATAFPSQSYLLDIQYDIVS